MILGYSDYAHRTSDLIIKHGHRYKWSLVRGLSCVGPVILSVSEGPLETIRDNASSLAVARDDGAFWRFVARTSRGDFPVRDLRQCGA